MSFWVAGGIVVGSAISASASNKASKRAAAASQMSPQELALLDRQLDLIDLSIEDRALLRPYMLESMGFVEEDGGIRRLTEGEIVDSQTESGGFAYRNLLATQGLLEEALAGGYSDPQFERNVTQQREQFETRMSQQLGPDWRQTTSGIQALEEFEGRVDISRSAIGNERIGLLTGISQSERGLQSTLDLREQAGFQSFAGADTGTSAALSSAQQPFQYTRGLQFQGALQQGANQAQLFSDVGAGLGYAGSRYARGLQTPRTAGVLQNNIQFDKFGLN